MSKSITKAHLSYILVKHPAPGDHSHRWRRKITTAITALLVLPRYGRNKTSTHTMQHPRVCQQHPFTKPSKWQERDLPSTTPSRRGPYLLPRWAGGCWWHPPRRGRLPKTPALDPPRSWRCSAAPTSELPTGPKGRRFHSPQKNLLRETNK